jgi:predicted nucleotidyltransferase
MQQETRSRRQLAERFDEFGWVPSRPDPDLGEDFIVHIYFEGQATGVTFHVQLKSITNLQVRRKVNYLVYDGIKVKDLKHWQDFSLPVVLFIWDVTLREGRWGLVDDLIADLDQRRPQWRENKSTARVYLPWTNTTDKAGLKKLTRRIGHFLYPQISNKTPIKSIRFKHQFPNTPEGWQAYKQLKRSLDQGETATIQGITGLEFSPSFLNQWMAPTDEELKEVTLSFAPELSNQSHFVNISMVSTKDKRISLPVAEFKNIACENGISQWSNKHQDPPLIFTLFLDSGNNKNVSLGVEPNHLGRSDRETQETLEFLTAAANKGVLEFSPLKDNTVSGGIVRFDNLEKIFPPEILGYFEKLAFIQKNTGHLIRLPGEIDQDDLLTIEKLDRIIKRGTVSYQNMLFSGQFKVEALNIMLAVHRTGKPVHFTITKPESSLDLFNKPVSMGRVTYHVTGYLDTSVADLEKAVQTLHHDEDFSIQIHQAEVVEIYPDWFIREAERLSKCLVEHFEVEAIYLFGSLVWREDSWHLKTDIDLAVRRLPDNQFFAAIGFLEQETEFLFDLVDLENLPTYLQQRILSEGKLLYERELIPVGG